MNQNHKPEQPWPGRNYHPMIVRLIIIITYPMSEVY